MATKSSKLYEKYCNGCKLTDPDILLGVELFKKAADSLVALGPCFKVSFAAANLMYLNFDSIAKARGIK